VGIARVYHCQPQCRICIESLLHETVRLSTEDEILRSDLIGWGLDILKREFSSRTIPALLATRLLREVKMKTGCRDPFEAKKRHEMDLGKEIFSMVKSNTELNDSALLEIAAMGNSLDHFKDASELSKVLNEKFNWAIDQGDHFWEQVHRRSGPCLYLADNAGEVFFDLPLFQRIKSSIPESYYVVKGGSIQNDLTLDDLRYTGLQNKFNQVITHGVDSVGLDVPRFNEIFRELYRSATLIVAKGMGHYETMSHSDQNGRVLFLLKAKCSPVAESLDVQKGAYVALLQ